MQTVFNFAYIHEHGITLQNFEIFYCTLFRLEISKSEKLVRKIEFAFKKTLNKKERKCRYIFPTSSGENR